MGLAPYLTQSGVHCRWMIRRDFAEVLAIDAASFPGRPWDERKLVAYLRCHKTIGMVAEDRAGRVVGFFVYVLAKSEIRLVRLAVHPGARRSGVGLAMLSKLIQKLHPQRSRLTLYVRESNLAACRFYRSAGIRAVEVVRGHYGDEDGYLFAYEAVEDV